MCVIDDDNRDDFAMDATVNSGRRKKKKARQHNASPSPPPIQLTEEYVCALFAETEAAALKKENERLALVSTQKAEEAARLSADKQLLERRVRGETRLKDELEREVISFRDRLRPIEIAVRNTAAKSDIETSVEEENDRGDLRYNDELRKSVHVIATIVPDILTSMEKAMWDCGVATKQQEDEKGRRQYIEDKLHKEGRQTESLSRQLDTIKASTVKFQVRRIIEEMKEGEGEKRAGATTVFVVMRSASWSGMMRSTRRSSRQLCAVHPPTPTQEFG